jgi:ribosomal protein S27AE
LFTRCHVCHIPFPLNEELEHFSRGQRLAFDPVRGRLWSVCLHCKRWSLVPMEERWEALEELEKAVTDRGRLLSQTDNIALIRLGSVDVVRVGRANLTEEAWWRYGRELRDRRQTFRKLTVAGSVGAGALVLGGWATGGLGAWAAWLLWDNAPEKLTDAARWLRFGGTAWRGRGECPRCGHVFTKLEYKQRSQLVLFPEEEDGEIGLYHRCPRCGADPDTGLYLVGDEARHTLRRVLAYHHFAGASEHRVRSATRLIQEVGSADRLSKILVKDGKRLGQLQRTGAIALEISANEAVEQRLLELELADLEAHWRREEELAEIVDGELTPLPLLETLRLRVVGRI